MPLELATRDQLEALIKLRVKYAARLEGAEKHFNSAKRLSLKFGIYYHSMDRELLSGMLERLDREIKEIQEELKER